VSWAPFSATLAGPPFHSLNWGSGRRGDAFLPAFSADFARERKKRFRKKTSYGMMWFLWIQFGNRPHERRPRSQNPRSHRDERRAAAPARRDEKPGRRAPRREFVISGLDRASIANSLGVALATVRLEVVGALDAIAWERSAGRRASKRRPLRRRPRSRSP
jgi:hypothetical protein